MNLQEEEYIYFVSTIRNLNEAWRILNAIKDSKENSLSRYAFKYALIEYSKPYKTSKGVIKQKYHLDTLHIPKQFLDIHKRIIDARDQIHAHADLTVMEAKLHIFNFQNNYYTMILENDIDDIEEMKNIDEIISLIEGTLDNMSPHLKKLENDLTP